jgi:hypothetical protein
MFHRFIVSEALYASLLFIWHLTLHWHYFFTENHRLMLHCRYFFKEIHC